jgi:hypothetical protein
VGLGKRGAVRAGLLIHRTPDGSDLNQSPALEAKIAVIYEIPQVRYFLHCPCIPHSEESRHLLAPNIAQVCGVSHWSSTPTLVSSGATVCASSHFHLQWILRRPLRCTWGLTLIPAQGHSLCMEEAQFH